MEKKIGAIRRFFGEFKKFITRGNVLDMAVGVIVGGAFTAIVNGLSNFILKPITNYLLALVIGEGTLNDLITPLGEEKFILDELGNSTGVYDLTQMIYIDWGSFINAVINFLLIAFVLFMIVRTMNKIAAAHERMVNGLEFDEKVEINKIRYEQKVSKKQAKEILAVRKEELKAQKAEEERLAAEKAAAEALAAEEKATANTRLLEEIRDLLKQK